jgi:hypothetical protein
MKSARLCSKALARGTPLTGWSLLPPRPEPKKTPSHISDGDTSHTLHTTPRPRNHRADTDVYVQKRSRKGGSRLAKDRVRWPTTRRWPGSGTIANNPPRRRRHTVAPPVLYIGFLLGEGSRQSKRYDPPRIQTRHPSRACGVGAGSRRNERGRVGCALFARDMKKWVQVKPQPRAQPAPTRTRVTSPYH